MKKEIFNRIKSPVVWLAVLAQILVIAGLYLPDIADHIKIVGTAIIEIATLFGILNNPSDKKNF